MAHGLIVQIVDPSGSTTNTSDKEYTRNVDFAIDQCNANIFRYLYLKHINALGQFLCFWPNFSLAICVLP